jgi:hypothetical protein
MLKTSMLILVLTVTLANGVYSAAAQSWPVKNDNAAVSSHPEERLFDRAKGNIDY